MATQAGQHLLYVLSAGMVCSELLRRRAEDSPEVPLLLFGEARWSYRECWLQSVVVPADEVEPTHHEIRDLCREFLPEFMLPRFLEMRRSLPVNHLGKVDKEELRQVSGSTVDLVSIE